MEGAIVPATQVCVCVIVFMCSCVCICVYVYLCIASQDSRGSSMRSVSGWEWNWKKKARWIAIDWCWFTVLIHQHVKACCTPWRTLSQSVCPPLPHPTLIYPFTNLHTVGYAVRLRLDCRQIRSVSQIRSLRQLFASDQIRFVCPDITSLTAWVSVVTT